MTPAQKPNPSAGSLRAAEEIIDWLETPDDGRPHTWTGKIAEIIDRETGAGKLAEAFERYIAESEGFMCDMVGDPDSELDEARTALAAWKEGA